MNIFGRDLQDLVETVLKWGALAYAFGFFIVWLHTSGLGIPTIQLADPVYVLIGFPMAVICIILIFLFLKIKSRMNELMQELEETRTRLTTR
jgi:surface polysaccharide O-acyltransferase-like enzyme